MRELIHCDRPSSATATWDVCEIDGGKERPYGVFLVLETEYLCPDCGHDQLVVVANVEAH